MGLRPSAELKENIRQQWWQRFVRSRADMVGLDLQLFCLVRVEASGHVATFTDPLVECLSCHKRLRQDHRWRTLRREGRGWRAWKRLLARTVALAEWMKWRTKNGLLSAFARSHGRRATG